MAKRLKVVRGCPAARALSHFGHNPECRYEQPKKYRPTTPVLPSPQTCTPHPPDPPSYHRLQVDGSKEGEARRVSSARDCAECGSLVFGAGVKTGGDSAVCAWGARHRRRRGRDEWIPSRSLVAWSAPRRPRPSPRPRIEIAQPRRVHRPGAGALRVESGSLSAACLDGLVLAPRGRGPFSSFLLPFVVLVLVVLSSSTTRGNVSLSVRARHSLASQGRATCCEEPPCVWCVKESMPRSPTPLSAAHGILSRGGGGYTRRTWDAYSRFRTS
ncbi:hypothetical protein B0H13DRAFT_2037436 [Mycena leptocephala]|nr:hypothetical protein B0H13DRAFT_2037436 [Mycena leptocephala]